MKICLLINLNTLYNITGMVSGIVAKLEKEFDKLPKRMKAGPSCGATWKKDALEVSSMLKPSFVYFQVHVDN